MSVTTPVTQRKGVKGERPILTGSKLSVVQVVELIEDGLTHEEVAESYPGIDSADQVRKSLRWIKNSEEYNVSDLREERKEAGRRLAEQAETY